MYKIHHAVNLYMLTFIYLYLHTTMIFCSVETTLTADGVEYDVVFTVGYFSEVLKAFWSTDPDGLWDDNSEVINFPKTL